jgi:hypothetical protein
LNEAIAQATNTIIKNDGIFIAGDAHNLILFAYLAPFTFFMFIHHRHSAPFLV